MNMANIKIKNTQPTPKEFVKLRSKVGWGDTDLIMASVALNNSLFHVSASLDSKLVGMGRVVGDGAMFYYIQDVVVDPEYQNQGIGGLLMEQIENYLSKNAIKGSTVGLLASQGKEYFYSRYGYIQRTGTPLGYGMCKFV